MLKAEQMELSVLRKHGASIRGLSRSTGQSHNGSAVFARWRCGGQA